MRRVNKTKRIGTLYMGGEFFEDEANQTIGAPALSNEVINNRRRVTEKTTNVGTAIRKRVIEFFKENYDIDVVLKWNIYAGCTMCPCSPGFAIIAINTDMKECDLFDSWTQFRPRGRHATEMMIDFWAAKSWAKDKIAFTKAIEKVIDNIGNGHAYYKDRVKRILKSYNENFLKGKRKQV